MPLSAPKPCGDCGVLVRDGTARCAKHKVQAGSFADTRRGTRHERGYGKEWDKLRQVALSRDKHLCQACLQSGAVTVGTHVDHVRPKSQGGSDDMSNLQTLCAQCHKTKTQREAVAARNAGLLTRLL